MDDLVFDILSTKREKNYTQSEREYVGNEYRIALFDCVNESLNLYLKFINCKPLFLNKSSFSYIDELRNDFLKKFITDGNKFEDSKNQKLTIKSIFQESAKIATTIFRAVQEDIQQLNKIDIIQKSHSEDLNTLNILYQNLSKIRDDLELDELAPFFHSKSFIDRKIVDIRELRDIQKSQPQTSRNDLPNKFNSIPINQVKEFFKSLHTEVNKGGESLLTIQQFEEFISRAFQGNKSNPPIKLNLKHGDKQRVQYLFYQFKEHCEGITGTNNEKYITLLTDNFVQYEFKTVKNNFDKEPDKEYQLPNPLNN